MNVEAALSSIRDGRLDQVETLKELERQLLDTLSNPRNLTPPALEDFSPILAKSPQTAHHLPAGSHGRDGGGVTR